jgi:hypothetical protein
VSRADVEAARRRCETGEPFRLCSIELKMPAVVLRNGQQHALGIELGIPRRKNCSKSFFNEAATSEPW